MKSIFTFFVTVLFSFNSMALNCHGTEPFWGAKITEDMVTLEGGIYEDAAINLPIKEVDSAAGFMASFMQIYMNSNGPVAVVTTNKCSDSMSDFTYPNEVIIFTGSSTLYGCCGKGVSDL